MTTADKIAQKRKENNLTQDGLASLLDVSRQAVSRWESGLAYPETDKLIKMSRIFNCTVDWLLKDNSEYNIEQTEEAKNTEVTESIDENTEQISEDTDCKGKTKNRQDTIDCIVSGGNGTQKILAVLAACIAMAGVLAIFILNFFTGTNLSFSFDGSVENLVDYIDDLIDYSSTLNVKGTNLYYYFYNAYADMAADCVGFESANDYYVVTRFLKCFFGTILSALILIATTVLTVICIIKFIKLMRGCRNVNFGNWVMITCMVYLIGVLTYNSFNGGYISFSGDDLVLSFSTSLNGASVAGISIGAFTACSYAGISIFLNARNIFIKKNVPRLALSAAGSALSITILILACLPLRSITYTENNILWTERMSYFDFAIRYSENWKPIIQVPFNSIYAQLSVFIIIVLSAVLVYYFCGNIRGERQRSGLVLSFVQLGAAVVYVIFGVGILGSPYNCEYHFIGIIAVFAAAFVILIISIVLAVLNSKSKKVD